MQSQGSTKTFTLYLGGIKAERRTRRRSTRPEIPAWTSPKSRDLNLGKSADQMDKRLGDYRVSSSLRSQEKGQPGRKAGLNLAVARGWLGLV